MMLLEPRSVASNLRFLAVFTVFFVAVLALDAQSTLPVQVLLGAATWTFVAFAARLAAPAERRPFLAMVGVATCYEVLGSVIWGLYRYRLNNLPMYVPPGHGLFYLAALRLSALPTVRRYRRPLIVLVLGAAALWSSWGALQAHPDLLGLSCWFLLAAFITHGRDPLFFAVSFVLTMILEYYGTALGTWQWQETVPYLGTPMGNPPSAIGAGYCVIDLTTRAAVTVISRLTTRHDLREGRVLR